MREKLLKKLASWHAHHPWRMLAIVFVLTLFFGWFAEHLTVTMRWSDLLPSGDPKTLEFNKVIDEFSSATSLVVVVQGEEERIKEFADTLAPQILGLVDTTKNEKNQKQIDKLEKKIEILRGSQGRESKITGLLAEIEVLREAVDFKLYKRVDYKAEIDFLRKRGLLLIKEENLRNMKDIFLDPNLTGLLFNLNTAMEKEYVVQE